MKILAQFKGDLPQVIKRFMEFNSEDALIEDFFVNPLFVRRLKEEFGDELADYGLKIYITETDADDRILVSPRIVGVKDILNLGTVELFRNGQKEFSFLVPLSEMLEFIKENIEEVKS